MTKHPFLWIAIGAILGASALLLISSKASESPEEHKKAEFHNYYRIFSLAKPEHIVFAGDTVSFEDPDLHEKLDRELLVNTYWQSNTLLMLKRAHQYFPIIEPILEQYGIPKDFKYLALAESGLQNLTSPAGAKGFWQIMPSTAKELGLEVNDEIDERYHIALATEAACKYLLNAKKELNNADWLTVAASYNMGVAGLQNQMERQKTSHYLDLLLNPETGRYVYRIMALKQIVESPKHFGFHVDGKDFYASPNTKTLLVDQTIENLADWAHDQGINYKLLKRYNPWLRDIRLPNSSGKQYFITIPEDGSHTVKHK